MSRAAWVGLLLLGAGVGLVAYLLTRGLPDEAKAQAKAAVTRVDRAKAALAGARSALDKTVAADAAYLGQQPEVAAAKATLAQRESELKAAEALTTGQLAKLLDRDKYGERGDVWKLSFDVGTRLDKVEQGLPAVTQPVQRLLYYKEHHGELVEQARTELRGVASYTDDVALGGAVAAALTECPDIKDDLNREANTIRGNAVTLTNSQDRINQLAAAQPLDYAKVGRAAETAVQKAKALRAQRTDFMGKLSKLSQSEDKILEDMKTDGGRYYHKYKTVKGTVGSTGSWQPVTRATYDKHRAHLGMSVYSKPECALDPVTVASPPGYSYIGNPRYGRWERRNGGSFWVFYGRYRLMQDLFWGPSYYRPISRRHYTSYRSSVRSGKAWFGSSRQYGTSGSTTRKKYSSSTYFKRSRASRRRSSSSSSGRYSGSRSSGSSSRSGGYRSSRYRSSSFGGSGK